MLLWLCTVINHRGCQNMLTTNFATPLNKTNRFHVAVALGPVVQRPISSNPGLNFNPAFFISLFKSLFGKIFTILFRTSNDQIASKKI